MAPNYLLELYQLIEARLKEIEVSLPTASTLPHLKGRQQLLLEFHAFLTANYHPKLPKKLRG